jgi:hypothetical protein
MGKNPKATPPEDVHPATADADPVTKRDDAAPAPAEATTADEQDAIPESGDNTVWLQSSTGTWHVEVGSETYTRLMAEGATEVPPPDEAQEEASDGTRDASGDPRAGAAPGERPGDAANVQR